MCKSERLPYINIYHPVFMYNKETNTSRKKITTTFLSGTTSCTLIIAKEIAKKYGIDEPSHVVVEGTEEGILIRKLEV